MKRQAAYCDGVSRRAVLQAGLAGTIGLGLSDLLRLQAQGAEQGGRTDTAIIYLELAGGPTQHETYDPKSIAVPCLQFARPSAACRLAS